MTESTTLGEALPKEQARVRKLIRLYSDPILNGSGTFAIMLMELALKEADEVTINQDTVGMLKAYNNLKGFEL